MIQKKEAIYKALKVWLKSIMLLDTLTKHRIALSVKPSWLLQEIHLQVLVRKGRFVGK